MQKSIYLFLAMIYCCAMLVACGGEATNTNNAASSTTSETTDNHNHENHDHGEHSNDHSSETTENTEATESNPEINALVGTWFTESTASGEELTLNADGTYSAASRGEEVKGKWTIADGKISMDGGEATPYEVNDKVLMIGELKYEFVQ